MKANNELKIPDELRQHAAQRTVHVTEKVRKAIKQMELDIESNEGIYPFNAGRITQAEVCRRAGINNMTLQGAAHKETTKKLVDDWVRKALAGTIKGNRNIRATVTARADDWKKAHADIAQAYIKADLLRIELEDRIKALENENMALREQLSQDSQRKVTGLIKRKPVEILD